MIRRAAELYAADAEADERISEEELLRIAAELGLPPRHVRQALLELPDAPADASLLDRLCGPAAVRGTRVVVRDADLTYRRLDEYLTTREYLQPVRRKVRRGWYTPAGDFVSKIARGLSRPKGRFHLARARGVALAVEPLDARSAHVRLDVDLSGRRREAVAAGATGGGIVGAALGAGLAAVAAGAGADIAGPYGAAAAGMLAFGGGLCTSLAAGIAIARAHFRKQLSSARLEVEGLLDRLERGEPLEPPPAPWRRRLRASVEGLRSGR
ncbi:MAG TPA: hypothetical protein VF158_06230 [Longimicrobiales bacterium]